MRVNGKVIIAGQTSNIQATRRTAKSKRQEKLRSILSFGLRKINRRSEGCQIEKRNRRRKVKKRRKDLRLSVNTPAQVSLFGFRLIKSCT